MKCLFRFGIYPAGQGLPENTYPGNLDVTVQV
jgi:hypothetical protein